MITNLLEIFQKAKKILYILNQILKMVSNRVVIKKYAHKRIFIWVEYGARTHDLRNHNPTL